MTAATIPFKGTAKQSIAFMARHRHIDGNVITTTNTSSVHVVISNDKDGITQTEMSLTPLSTYILNSLKTDRPKGWEDDCNEDANNKGYNFEYTAPASAFPRQAFYRVEFRFTDVLGEVTKLVFEGPMGSTSQP